MASYFIKAICFFLAIGKEKWHSETKTKIKEN